MSDITAIKEKRSQGALEYLLMLGSVLVIIASVLYLTSATFQSLGSNVGGEIENMKNEIIDSLASLLKP